MRIGYTLPRGGGQAAKSFSDNFTRADGGLGVHWLSQTRRDADAQMATDCHILGNKAHMEGPLFSGNGNNHAAPCVWIPRDLIFYDSIASGPGGIWNLNQYARFTWGGGTTSGSGARYGVSIHCRHEDQGDYAQGYHLLIRMAGGGAAIAAVELVRNTLGNDVASTWLVLATTSSGLPVAGDILEINSAWTGTSSVLLTYKKNGTVVYTATDNTPLLKIGYPVMTLFSGLGTHACDFTSFACGTP